MIYIQQIHKLVGQAVQESNSCTVKSNKEQDNVDLDKVRVPAFRKKNVAETIVAAAKSTVEKLLTAPTNRILKGEREDKQDMNMSKVWIWTKINKSRIAANARKPVICWNIKKRQRKR